MALLLDLLCWDRRRDFGVRPAHLVSIIISSISRVMEQGIKFAPQRRYEPIKQPNAVAFGVISLTIRSPPVA